MRLDEVRVEQDKIMQFQQSDGAKEVMVKK